MNGCILLPPGLTPMSKGAALVSLYSLAALIRNAGIGVVAGPLPIMIGTVLFDRIQMTRRTTGPCGVGSLLSVVNERVAAA